MAARRQVIGERNIFSDINKCLFNFVLTVIALYDNIRLIYINFDRRKIKCFDN